MYRLNYAIALAFLLLTACGKTIDNTGTCHDGIKNHGEQEIDCGGPCPNHCESCGDGIRNQGETAVDCGGPCEPCYSRMIALINGTGWNATSRNAFQNGPDEIQIYGTNGQGASMTLHYRGAFAPGVTPAGPDFSAEFRKVSGSIFESANVGSITIFSFDTMQRKVSGAYEFLAQKPGTNSIISVSKGSFTEISY